MELNRKYVHELCFSLHPDAPQKFIKRWQALKDKCESGDNKDIVESIKKYSRLDSTKKLPYLKRCEGGIGGDNNILHKQMRFRHKLVESIVFYNNVNDIIIDNICDGDTEKWTYEELDDIIYGFIKTAYYYVDGGQCINGCILLTNNTMIPDE